MASRRARLRRMSEDQRDVPISSLDSLLSVRAYTPEAVVPRIDPLHLEDRREYYPDTRVNRPASSVSRVDRSLVVKQREGASRVGRGNVPAYVSFKVPERVSVCVRRKQRKEVIFALKKTGKGSRSRRRRNQWSDVRC